MKNKLVAIAMLAMLLTVFIPISLTEASGSGGLGGFWYLDEGTGNIAYDSSGNGNHGTVYGGAIWTTGKIGKALKFDGVNDYIQIPDSNSLDITGKITMEAWIYPYNVSKTDCQVIVQKYNYSGPPYNGAYYLGLGGYGYTNKILLGLSHNGYNFYYTLSNTNITANTWTHVAATSNGTHMIIYINGVKDKVAAYPPGVIYASAAPLRIGCFLPELGVKRFFDGIIDEVRVSAGTIWTVDDDKAQCPNADFTSIQAAINTASPHDTILVHDGTYHEALYINKALTLKAASTPVIKGSQLVTTNYYNIDAVIFVENALGVFIEGFDIEGDGWTAPRKHAVQWEDSTGIMRNCIVSANTIGDMNALGISFWDNSDLTIDSCTIKNFGRVGVYCRNSSTGGVYDSTIIGQVYSDESFVNYGIEVEGLFGACDIEIIGNEIYNCDNTCSPEPLWSSAGIMFDGFWQIPPEYLPLGGPMYSSTVMIENNEIHDNYYGIEAVTNALSYAHYNNIYDNREYGVVSSPDYNNNYVTFDARFNWWGDGSGPTHSSNPSGTGDKISDNVDYSPWLGFVVGTSPMTYHVNPTGTIQEAIDEAAHGDTIIVHEGTYNEALYIGKSITLKAASSPIIEAPDTIPLRQFTGPSGTQRNRPIIFVYGDITATIDGFTIDGRGVGNSNYGFMGIQYFGASGTIKNNIVKAIRDTPLSGAQHGNAIVVNHLWDQYQEHSVTIINNTVFDYQKNGITCNEPGTSVQVSSNTATGCGATNIIAQNGIQLGWNATGIVDHNVVSGHKYINVEDWWSCGILLYLYNNGSIIEYNNITDNNAGIYVYASSGVEAHYNNIYGNTEYGLYNEPSPIVDATYNWWGHSTGPNHETSWEYMGEPYGPHYGLGDNVSDYVLYDPWLEYPWPAPPPTIKVEPPISQMQMLNKTFSINITINDLSVGYKAIAVQFRLCYNNTLLEVVNVAEGPFMQDPKWNLEGTFFIYFVEDDPMYGPNVLVGVMLLPNDTGYWNAFPSGSGTLATITFKMLLQERGLEKPPLTCNLALKDTLVLSEDLEIPHSLENGLYEMYPTHIGDFDYNGKVDMKDVRRVAKAFASYPGHERWDPICEITGDDKIDMKDIRIVAKGFGWTPTYDP